MSDHVELHEGGSVRPPIIERVVRPQDADPKRADSAERKIALMFLLSAVGTVGFIAAYLAVPSLKTTEDVYWSNFWLGIALTVSLGGLAVGIIAWVRWLMPAHEVVQERHPLAASDADLEIASQIIVAGVEETGIARRSLLKRSLGLALGVFALPGVLLLRDLGPLPARASTPRCGRRTRRFSTPRPATRSSSETSRSGPSPPCCRCRSRTCPRRTTRRRRCF